jgi:hypothetical protein
VQKLEKLFHFCFGYFPPSGCCERERGQLGGSARREQRSHAFATLEIAASCRGDDLLLGHGVYGVDQTVRSRLPMTFCPCFILQEGHKLEESFDGFVDMLLFLPIHALMNSLPPPPLSSLSSLSI